MRHDDNPVMRELDEARAAVLSGLERLKKAMLATLHSDSVVPETPAPLLRPIYKKLAALEFDLANLNTTDMSGES